MSSHMAPIFMIGMGRSGTSVLSEAISVHDDLAWISNIVKWIPCVPQLSALNRVTEIKSLGNILRGKKKQQSGFLSSIRRILPRSDEAYPVWDRLCGEFFSKSYLLEESLEAQQRDRVREYFQILCKAHGKARLFAKFTGPPRIRFLNQVFPDAHYIHVVRDPRAVVSSLLKVNFWKNGKGQDEPWWAPGFGDDNMRIWRESGKKSTILAALQWKRVEELTAMESASLPNDQFMTVRYEDFVEQPHAMLADVFKRFQLAPSKRAHDYLENAGRLINMNHKYEVNLTKEQILDVERVTCEYAANNGYTFS